MCNSERHSSTPILLLSTCCGRLFTQHGLHRYIHFCTWWYISADYVVCGVHKFAALFSNKKWKRGWCRRFTAKKMNITLHGKNLLASFLTLLFLKRNYINHKKIHVRQTFSLEWKTFIHLYKAVLRTNQKSAQPNYFKGLFFARKTNIDF